MLTRLLPQAPGDRSDVSRRLKGVNPLHRAVLNKIKPDPLYSERFDFDMNDKITITDVGFFIQLLNEFCSP